MKNFKKKYNKKRLSDAGSVVSKDYKGFQKSLLCMVKKIAAMVGGTVVKHSHGHYFESYFIERDGKYVYINHENLDRTYIDMDARDFFLVRTAASDKDYRGGTNQYSSLEDSPELIEKLLNF